MICTIVHGMERITSGSDRVSRFLNYYDKFDSNWLGVAVKLVFMGLDGQMMARYHEVNADQDRVEDSAEDSIWSGRFTKKSKPVHCSIWSTETV